jgi:hypothetical protein
MARTTRGSFLEIKDDLECQTIPSFAQRDYEGSDAGVRVL